MKRKYKGKYIQRERRIYHGDYLDVNIFPVFKKPGKRKKKTNPSSEIQKKLNQTYRENKVTYLINNNFSKKDLEIGLDLMMNTYLKHIQMYRELFAIISDV